MGDKECPSILEQAVAIPQKSGAVVAWIGRLSSELSGGFCKDRICSECPVGQFRRGVSDVALNSREMVISAVSGALQAAIAGDSSSLGS